MDYIFNVILYFRHSFFSFFLKILLFFYYTQRIGNFLEFFGIFFPSNVSLINFANFFNSPNVDIKKLKKKIMLLVDLSKPIVIKHSNKQTEKINERKNESTQVLTKCSLDILLYASLQHNIIFLLCFGWDLRQQTH
jgi:uncharacterized membrane protein